MQGNLTQGVISEAWGHYKAHWTHFAAIGLIVYVVVSLLTLLLSILGVIGLLLAAGVSVVGVFWLQGTLVKAVEDIRDGRADLSVGETFSAVRGSLGRIIGAGLLAGVGIAIGLVLLIVPGLYLMTIWSVLIPALVIENLSISDAFSRSKNLVNGYGMNVFGIILLTFLILLVFGLVLGAILVFLPDWLQGFLSDLVSGVVTGPFIALVWTLLYFRLRQAKAAGEAPGEPSPPPAAPTG